jgi:hypothetical protein
VPSSSSISPTQALTVTITASEVSGGPTPTGVVTLTCGSYTSAATPLVNGSATITIPAGTLAPGLDYLGASYGVGNYNAASGEASVTVVGPNPGFTITGTAVSVTAGAASGNSSAVTVAPAGGFTGSVALAATITSSPSGGQSLPTLSFGSTNPVSITGTVAGTAALTIATTTAGGCTQAYQAPRGLPWYTGGGAVLGCVLLFGVPARRRRWRLALALLALFGTLMGGLLACGGGGSSPPCTTIPGTTPGAYTITVTGTSGASTATGTVNLTVH